MAIKKKSHGDDEFATAEITDEAQREQKPEKQRDAARSRKPLAIAGIVAGGVLALGAAFGVGLVAGHAAPGFPGGAEFAAGAGPMGGHGDRDGDRGGDHRGGLGTLEHSGEARVGEPGGAAGGDFCHPGDGHTHDAEGNDVAPSDAAEGFTCQTGPADGTEPAVPAPGASTTP